MAETNEMQWEPDVWQLYRRVSYEKWGADASEEKTVQLLRTDLKYWENSVESEDRVRWEKNEAPLEGPLLISDRDFIWQIIRISEHFKNWAFRKYSKEYPGILERR